MARSTRQFSAKYGAETNLCRRAGRGGYPRHTAGHATASAFVYIATPSEHPIVMSAATAAPCRLVRASPTREANAATAARRLRGARASPADLTLRGSGARAWSRVPAVSRAPVRRRGFTPRAATASDGPFPYPVIDRTAKTLTLTIGDSEVTIETGRIGLQANGAVVVTEGETVMYATICAGREVTADGGFVPLTVNYQERFSAVGKTAGGYRKRDGGLRENETLVGRLVDRPLRPMIPKGWAYDTQIMEWVLSYDGVRSTDALAITAASAVAAISDVPLKKPIAGVRVGWAPGGSEPLINPTVEQMRDSRLDLVLAGTEDAVMMIEGFGDFLTVDEMLYAIEKGHEAVAKACKDIKAWAEEVGREKKTDKMLVAPEGVDAAVAEAVGPDLATAMAIGPKQMRGAAVEKVRNTATDALKDQFQVRRLRRLARFPDSQTLRAHSPKGPRRVPLVGPRASGPTAESAEQKPRSLRTHARPTLGSHPGTSDVVALHAAETFSRAVRVCPARVSFFRPTSLRRRRPARAFLRFAAKLSASDVPTSSHEPPRANRETGERRASGVRPHRVPGHSRHDPKRGPASGRARREHRAPDHVGGRFASPRARLVSVHARRDTGHRRGDARG